MTLRYPALARAGRHTACGSRRGTAGGTCTGCGPTSSRRSSSG
ncbi:hypothetical protein IEO21_08291 [Rhodonia placenta]|uniref:Uncharacterized protein n=1 Tax=Rhodonia placenta TaxID=104341 RepID=A0A8H7NWR8_9APHY|nr:hypothetical protein IEO21_08291 [Postia placenta]